MQKFLTGIIPVHLLIQSKRGCIDLSKNLIGFKKKAGGSMEHGHIQHGTMLKRVVCDLLCNDELTFKGFLCLIKLKRLIFNEKLSVYMILLERSDPARIQHILDRTYLLLLHIDILVSTLQCFIYTYEMLLVNTLIAAGAGNRKQTTQIKRESFHSHKQISDKITKNLLHL